MSANQIAWSRFLIQIHKLNSSETNKSDSENASAVFRFAGVFIGF